VHTSPTKAASQQQLQRPESPEVAQVRDYAAGMTATGGTSGYALTLSEDELRRYRFMADAARQSEHDLWHAAGITPGATVADIGCGPGALFPAIMDVIGPAGRLIGVDGNAGTVAAAHAMIDAHLWPNATVQVGQAEATKLPDGSVDVAMVRHLGHNGPTEQQIVDHLAALVRPGGHRYLVDVDASMFRVGPSDPDVESLDETYRAFHPPRERSRGRPPAESAADGGRPGGRRLPGLDPGPRDSPPTPTTTSRGGTPRSPRSRPTRRPSSSRSSAPSAVARPDPSCTCRVVARQLQDSSLWRAALPTAESSRPQNLVPRAPTLGQLELFGFPPPGHP
jgi:SAM-dependent methyltransferase